MGFEMKCNMSQMWSSDVQSGLDFEITHHPLTTRKVVHLIIAMERMKGSESTLSTEFRDENLLNFIMDSIVEGNKAGFISRYPLTKCVGFFSLLA